MENICLKDFDAVKSREDFFISDANSGFNPINGVFTARDDGVYLLTAHIHFSKKDSKAKNDSSNAESDKFPMVKVEICVTEDCGIM